MLLVARIYLGFNVPRDLPGRVPLLGTNRIAGSSVEIGRSESDSATADVFLAVSEFATAYSLLAVSEFATTAAEDADKDSVSSIGS